MTQSKAKKIWLDESEHIGEPYVSQYDAAMNAMMEVAWQECLYQMKQQWGEAWNPETEKYEKIRFEARWYDNN